MALPQLPAENETHWYAKRNAFDQAVKGELEGRLSEAGLTATIDDAIAADVPRLIGERLIGANTWSSIGDSISAKGSYITNGSGGGDARDQSWQLWANTYLGQRLQPVVAYAVGGKTTGQMVDEQLPQVLANPTTYCTLLGGVNDIYQGVTGDAIIENLRTMIRALVDAGIRPIVGEMTPVNGLNELRLGYLNQVNAWIRQVAPTLGAWVVAWAHALANADGSLKADAFVDDLHPSPYGADLMGRAFAKTLDGLIPRLDRLPASNLESPSVAIISNPMMIGTGGTVGAGGSGAVATSWMSGAWSGQSFSASASKVERTDGVPGEWQQFVLPEGTSAQLWQVCSTVSRWDAGDRFEVVVEVETDSDFGIASGAEVWALCQPSGRVSVAFAISDASTQKSFPRAGVLPTPPVVRTPPVTIPSGTTQVWALVRVKGAVGTIRIGRASLQKVVSN